MRVDGARVRAQHPAGRVEVVDPHVHDEAAAVAIGLLRREVLAADRVHRERLADRPALDQSPQLPEPGVVPAVVRDADDELGLARRLLGDPPLTAHVDRAGLLEQQMLAGAEHLDGVLRVVDRARRDEHRVEPVVAPELLQRYAPHVQLGGQSFRRVRTAR